MNGTDIFALRRVSMEDRWLCKSKSMGEDRLDRVLLWRTSSLQNWFDLRYYHDSIER